MNRKFFKKNRENFYTNMKKNSIAVFFSKDVNVKGDNEYFDFCDPNIFYLTGVDQANIKLIMHKNSKNEIKSYLFVQQSTKFLETWHGKKLSIVQSRSISGIDNVYLLKDFEDKFDKLSKKIKHLYTFEHKMFDTCLNDYKNFIKKSKRKLKGVSIESSAKIISKLRQVKSSEEITQLQNAMEITSEAFLHVLKNLKKLKNEAQVSALLSFDYIRNHTKHSYEPICASGANSCIMHYVTNKDNFKKNDLILIDSGCEINNYKNDISRTFPVSGKFTKRQELIYETCLKVQKYAISIVKVGMNFRDLDEAARKFMSIELIKIGLIKKKDYDKDEKIVNKFYPHSIGHFLGLDTHDLASTLVLEEGHVITIEPGIYINKEKIGIRIEDNILVTNEGPVNLSKSIPKEIDEIERIMNN